MRGFDVTNTSASIEFVPKLLDSQAFSLFVQDNGPPFRRLHKFDEVSLLHYLLVLLDDLSSPVRQHQNTLKPMSSSQE